MVEKEIPAVAAEQAVQELVTSQPNRILSMVPTLRDPTALLRGAISPAENAASGLARYAEKLGDAANIRTHYYDRDFSNAIKQFSSSRDARVRSFAEAAQSSMNDGNQREAELALSFAEVLTRFNGISKAYRSQDWAKAFTEFADSVKGGVPKERVAEALTALHDADSSISNARRSDAMDSLSRSNNQFVKKELDEIKGMFAEGRDKDADMALAFLYRYNAAYNRKDVVSDGAAETRTAVEMAIRGEPGAEKKFQEAMASYTLGKICVQVAAKLSEFRDELLAIDKEGKQGKLRDLLNDAETSIGRRDPDAAVRKLNEFVPLMNSLKAEMALGKAEDRLLEVRTLLEQFRKQLDLVPSDTPHVGAVLEKLGGIDSEAAGLRDLVIGVRRGTGSAAELETKLKAFSSRWEEFSSFYSVSKLVLDELAKTRRFEAFVRNSENMDHSLGKSAALTHLTEANEHLQESLRRLVYEGDTQSAKREFRQAVDEKLGALPFLYLNGLSVHEHIELGLSNKNDPANQFAFYSQALNALFDASVKKSDFESRAKMSEAIFRLENVLAISEDSIFARGEGEIQRKAISDAQKLIVNYTKVLGGGKPAVPAADAAALERSLEAETIQLNKTVERSRKISQVVEFGASFVHPAVLAAVAIKNLTKEYRMSSTMQWSTGLMLVASTLALRHAGVLKGALEGVEATIAGKALRGAEIGIGLTLSGAGAKSIYDQLASGKSLKDVSFEAAMLFVPLAYATVRPVVAGKTRAFAGKRFESLVERDWSEQAAASSGMERLRLEFSSDGGLVEARPESTAPTMNVRGTRTRIVEEGYAKTELVEAPPGSDAERENAVSATADTFLIKTTPSKRPSLAPEPVSAEQLGEGGLILSGIKRNQPGFFSDFSKLDAEKQDALISTLRPVSPEMATQLSEFAALKNLAKEYGMIPEQLEKAYSGASNLADARSRLLCYIESTGRIFFGLGAKGDREAAASMARELTSDVPDLVSLLLSEDLIGKLRKSYPEQMPEGAMISDMIYRGGMHGTFEVIVRLPDGMEQQFFAKTTDSRSARLGSNSSLEAGHPAPHVSEDWAFKNHATGNTGVCWFMLPIQEFTGTIKIAGRGVVVQETLEAINLKKIVSAKDSALNRLYETHRDIYYRELGRAQAGWMQSGIYDGNEQNAYAMFVRVSEEDGAFLKEKGYHVEVDNGVSKLFIVGRIDTDWAGSYGASFDGARYDFEHMFGQLGGHDMARILVKSTRERMISGGEEPTTEELAREARKELEAARPHFIEGASQWYRTNGSDPSYVDGMKKLFLDNRDAPVGMEEKLSPEDLRDISEGKRILDRRLSFNGLSARPMDFSDGKSRFVPEDAIAVFNALHFVLRNGPESDVVFGHILNLADKRIEFIAGTEMESQVRGLQSRGGEATPGETPTSAERPKSAE